MVEINSRAVTARKVPLNLKNVIKRRLPIVNWLPQYTFATLLQDILAGITVGLTEIPQGIAYASVAGLQPQYGLYSGFMGCFIYCVFGSVKDINIGPTAILAIMIQPYVERLGAHVAILMTFLAGCIIFLLGVFNLGFVVEFFSYPVIAGFTSAASLTIASSQLNGLFGLKGKGNEFLDAWKSFIENVSNTSLYDSLLGVSTIVILVLMRQLKNYGSLHGKPEWSKTRLNIGRGLWLLSLGRNALLVVIGALLAYIFQLYGHTPFKLIDNVVPGLPPFEPPPFSTVYNGTYYDFIDITKEFGGALAFLPLIAVLETIAIAKAFSKGKTVDATQEMLALGLCNIFGSFVSSMPVTGSFTRTAVNNASGVKTTLGGILTGSMVLLALGFLTSSFTYIPKTVLSAVVICAMFYLFEYEAIILFWRTNKLDLIPYTVTLIASLILGLEYGIIIGVVINLLFVLYNSARPRLHIEREKIPNGEVFLVRLERVLQFPAAEYIRERIMTDCHFYKTPVVIDGSNVTQIDITVAKNIQTLTGDLILNHQKIILWNFNDNIKNIIVGTDKKLVSYFQYGTLEEVVQVDEDFNNAARRNSDDIEQGSHISQ